AIAANTVAFTLKGFSADIANFVSLSGDLGFAKTGTDIVAVGSNVTAALSAGTSASLRLSNASFGLRSGAAGTTAFELANGTLTATVDGLGNLKATSVAVQYTGAAGAVTAGSKVSVGSQSYTFSQAIAANTVAFSLKGFSADIANFVSLSGDLGFAKTGTDIVAVGSNVTAALSAGTSASLRLSNASFGLRSGAAGTTAFELANGTLTANVDGLGNLKATSVAVQYTGTAGAVTAGTKVSVGSQSYTFSQAIAANTVAFTLKGFSADIANFVSLSGDLGFAKTGTDIVAVGSNVTA
ncbi:hypothetical protein, partial [Azohydromonas lata]